MLTPPPRSPIEPGQALAGRYRIERQIGAGAMGVVVEAWHIELRQRVAIKFLYPQLADNLDLAERFRREARAAGSIDSEHVAKVLDTGTLDEGRTHYYVMEYLQGNDLARELAEQGPLPVSTAVDYVLQACHAIGAAHARGIVHRDLKPANLFVVERPNGERLIKVLDFGISKFTELGSKQFSITNSAVLMGSPAYMSPEQLESTRDVDGRADIWSLGVILHELILGEVPFKGESVLQFVRSVLAGGRPSLLRRDGVPLELEAIVTRCLKQERSERFENIEALAAALRPLSTGAQATRDAALGEVREPRLTRHTIPLGSLRSLGNAPAPSPESMPGQTERVAQRSAQPEPSSWGSTWSAAGRRQLLWRRSAYGAAAAAGLGMIAYFGLRTRVAESEPPAPSAALDADSSNGVAPPPAMAEPTPAAARASEPTEPEPSAALAPIAPAEPSVPAEPSAGATVPSVETEPPPPVAATAPERAPAPWPTRVNPAPSSAALAARPTAARPAARPTSIPAASRPSASTPAPAAPEGEGQAQPELHPDVPPRQTNRSPLDIPDYGGRK
jgi:serine/threonine-protein kinase